MAMRCSGDDGVTSSRRSHGSSAPGRPLWRIGLTPTGAGGRAARQCRTMEYPQTQVPVHPHPLANEMTDEALTPSPTTPGEPKAAAAAEVERRMTRKTLLLAGGLAGVALIVAAI